MFSPLQQLAARLLLIIRSNGKLTPNGIEIQVKLTQEELGRLTGASRQSINKELKELQKINLIEINNKKLTVLDMTGL
jgi:CRP/FNR family cyclic AMP-dependent transcriptional regulator